MPTRFSRFLKTSALAAGLAVVQLNSQSLSMSMADVKKLIERELPLAGEFDVVTKPETGTTNDANYSIGKVSLSDCRFSFLQTEHLYMSSPGGFTKTSRWIATLKDVDVNKIVVSEDHLSKGETRNRPYFNLALVALVGTDNPFSLETQIDGGAKRVSPARFVVASVGDQASATRIAAALRQAAILCGAPDPGPTAPLAATTPTASEVKPSTTSSGTMTNEDVVKLVTAGLSEQVIVTSIRQARTTDFDLSPSALVALKKASVSDAVIVGMQEKAAGSQADAPPAPPPAPKYDSSLTAKPKETSAPEPSNGCGGIEAMGLFKNTTGVVGLVEWLARIRNNGGIAKIVTYSWIDMYGQVKKAQVQIQGGQIASIRLDLTKNMVIPPVKALQLVSCQ